MSERIIEEPQDYGHPANVPTTVETVDIGIPENTAPADGDVQSDPALTVYPGADWADEGGAPAS